jgi:hypothetical protein
MPFQTGTVPMVPLLKIKNYYTKQHQAALMHFF